jgi:hypothetical protein
MLVADIEHRQRLIDTYDPAAFQTLRHRPSHSTGAGRHVENPFVALQSEHLGQSVSEISADLRRPAIELRGVLRIMETSFVLVPMAMLVTVPAFMIMRVMMTVLVIMVMIVIMFVIAFVFFFHYTVPVFFTFVTFTFTCFLPSLR